MFDYLIYRQFNMNIEYVINTSLLTIFMELQTYLNSSIINKKLNHFFITKFIGVLLVPHLFSSNKMGTNFSIFNLYFERFMCP